MNEQNPANNPANKPANSEPNKITVTPPAQQPVGPAKLPDATQPKDAVKTTT